MKTSILYMGLLAASLTTITSCKKDSFGEYYKNQGKVSESTPEKQFTGMIYGFRALIIPTYGNYFITLRPTINLYIQNLGSINQANQLLPGSAATEERWNKYYEGLAQYKEFTRLYDALSTEDKLQKKVMELAAKVIFYDQTEQMVDLYGAIPWSEAGKLMANGGDYTISYAKYDQPEDIYGTMLDDLKTISTELNTVVIPEDFTSTFKTQDLINNGDRDLWRKYCNSLRLRMLTRVSESSQFSARAKTEIAEIIGNQKDFPLILTNSENAQIDIFNTSSDIKSEDIKGAFEAGGSWYANLASKPMIDEMNRIKDPRRQLLFEKGSSAGNVYIGLDQTETVANQTALAKSSTLSSIHRNTISRNRYLPGLLMTASEVNFLLAEYYTKQGDNATAKSVFETALKESVDLYTKISQKSDDATITKAAVPTATQITDFIATVDWNGASNKIQLIAMQKWLHFNLFQAVQNWSEQRRLDYPKFTIPTFNSDRQKTVPVRFTLPQAEATYNTANYNAVKAQDTPDTKLFWDVN
ncbi:MAG: SusD/RagB family nutrient-binding outer membrane lipoprotein [Sphingobacterium sp.]|jgi:tetratricopeptide (TPR) repeat protein|uniref:SusD/RagB family nutrient-binding outer membrane lipoprotein n=1 Tax=Sphingobacterium sp. TaxID=341027 RepID=UPI00284B6DE5|nr:SusD/RagB family nutrient-binding outer membrane lipoprotein [Sphingobacterium sp.]MDR3009325.1 SusD/RagB family nutrient-binding outer membrane lipoprotein [Sphingobacterium sp.]